MRQASRRGSAGSVTAPAALPPPEYREKSDNEQNTRLEQIVREAISTHHLNLSVTSPGHTPSNVAVRQAAAQERQYQLTRQHESGSRGNWGRVL